MRRITQRLLGGEAIAGLVLAKDIENRNGMRGRFYASDVDFFQLLSVLQNITELFLKSVAQFVLAPDEFLLLLVERRPGFERATRHAAISALCHEKEEGEPDQAKHNQR